MKNDDENKLTDKTVIYVCDKCFMACCLAGEFMCEDSRTAGTTKKTIKELKKLNVEQSRNWENQVKRRGVLPCLDD